jgi:predicted ATP-grasp superfamily ATP-dependent carboligase
MRVFFYEYTCASGAGAALQAEGQAMLRALAEDLAALPGVESATMLQARLDLHPSARVCRVKPACEKELFRELSRWADFTLVIAPEFEDILLSRTRWVEEAGGRLLGPGSTAVKLTADKLSLCKHLQSHAIPTPDCRPIDGAEIPGDLPYPLVWKPRFGAGSQATFLLQEPGAWHRCRADARAEDYRGEMLLQRFVAGLPVSVAFLLGPRQTVALVPALQLLSQDGRFHYVGGTLPLPGRLAERATSLATRAVASVPGLFGYVGVDLVLGETEDWVIEINPRLTTSYVGLRAVAKMNLVEAMLRIVQGIEVANVGWREAAIRFDASGKVEILSTEYPVLSTQY